MTRPCRLSRIAAAAALSGSLITPQLVRAQTTPPPAQAPAEAPAAGAAAPAADPPARAGRVARLTGTVSFHGPGADQWEAATLNFPVTNGDAVWTEPAATAAIEIGGSRLTLAGATELDVDKLDADAATLTSPQGEVFLRLQNLAPGESYTLVTPRGTVSITQAGQYEIAAGDQSAPTTVTVLEGQAQVVGEGLNLAVQPGQTASVTGDGTFQGSVGPQHADAFLATMQQQAAPAVQTAQSAPPPAAVQGMPGAEDLSQAGQWQPSPNYGTVWYPSVAANWVPYRDGRWAYVAPWGWTWVDNASWGFAPFHYGRWVQVDNRWGWAPVYAAPGFAVSAGYFAPVYAPALVSFVGLGVGIGIGVGIGASVGWLPLGWGEPFHPWYGGSNGYWQGVNRGYVRNVTNITNIRNTNVTINNYANRGAATVVPASTMTGSRPVAAAARPLSPQQLAGLHPTGANPVKPTATTAGVTPTVAHQLGLPAARAAGARPATPGPAIGPAANTAGAHPGALAPAGGAHPAAPGPAIAPHSPGATTPAPSLRPAAGAATAGAVTPHAAGTTPAVVHAPTTPAAGIPHAPKPAVTPHAPAVTHPTPQVAPHAPPVPHATTPHATTPHATTPHAMTPQTRAAAPSHAPAHAPAPAHVACKPGQHC